MFREKKFVRKMSKFDRRIKKAPDMAEIRGNTPNLEERPKKYLVQALEKLNLSDDLKTRIMDVFEYVKLGTQRLRGYKDPMPDLAGIIYFVCKMSGENLDRESIADAFGINKEMVTQGHKVIKSKFITDVLYSKADFVTCPNCFGSMNFKDSCWRCPSCTTIDYAYDLHKSFLRVNKPMINRLLPELLYKK